jgi:Holliday junction resolvase RusA-like endonuclease
VASASFTKGSLLLARIEVSSNKVKTERYDYEFAVTGFIPSFPTKNHELAEGERPPSVQAFRTQLRDKLCADIASKNIVFSLDPDERFHITVIQFTGKTKTFSQNDVDNFGKTILDALNGIVFSDDGQVESLVSSKAYEKNYGNDAYIGVKRISKDKQFAETLKTAGVIHAKEICDDVLSVAEIADIPTDEDPV